jgi:hypothetical protein
LKKLQVIKNDAKLQKSAEKLGVLFRTDFSRFLTIKLLNDVKKLENGKKVEKAYFSSFLCCERKYVLKWNEVERKQHICDSQRKKDEKKAFSTFLSFSSFFDVI